MVITTDGLSLGVKDKGPRHARACIFIHGIAQSHAIWNSVFASSLINDHRLVAFDLRGHGESDKPADVTFFARSRLANDLAAVITDLHLDRPVVIAWSFGGVVVGEYLRQHGEAMLGGLVFLAASIRTGKEARALFGPAMLDHARDLLAEDPATYAAGARAFLQGCAASALPKAAFEHALENMQLVPAHVRRAFLMGGEDYRQEISRTRLPVTTMHGERDNVVLPAMSQMIAGLRSGVKELAFPNVGHVPWLEAPEVFHEALRSVIECHDAI